MASTLEKGSELDRKEQLIFLRDLLVAQARKDAAACVLHEAQVLQLKLWPVVVYPHVDRKHEFTVDFYKKLVKFKLKAVERAPTKMMHRGNQLLEWVRFLLGKDWKIEVLIDGERAYPTKANRHAKRTSSSRR
jgi:hypothetical protein